ncbi:hypothetical protein WA026_010921 [Henosepilachna vigintioctopunctata]|uniref:Uncharacterized protein n=1 Tax=Henosepilachna vigintioctopunctata TaxID=420089 RepID=A0AAW1UQG3_9CUCU
MQQSIACHGDGPTRTGAADDRRGGNDMKNRPRIHPDADYFAIIYGCRACGNGNTAAPSSLQLNIYTYSCLFFDNFSSLHTAHFRSSELRIRQEGGQCEKLKIAICSL